jgi:hypothetical protein
MLNQPTCHYCWTCYGLGLRAFCILMALGIIGKEGHRESSEC